MGHLQLCVGDRILVCSLCVHPPFYMFRGGAMLCSPVAFNNSVLINCVCVCVCLSIVFLRHSYCIRLASKHTNVTYTNRTTAAKSVLATWNMSTHP